MEDYPKFVLVETPKDKWVLFMRGFRFIISITKGKPYYVITGTHIITYDMWKEEYEDVRNLMLADFVIPATK